MKYIGSQTIQFPKQLVSTVPTGTAPFAVNSTTMVSNLNAEMISGKKFTVANTAPTTPNVNDLWVDTSVSPALFHYWGGTEWLQCGGVGGGGMSIVREEFTATAGQTVFNLAGKYIPGSNSMTVYAGGYVLPPSYYTETDTDTVTIGNNVVLDAGDKVVFEYGKLTSEIEVKYKVQNFKYNTTLAAATNKVDIAISNVKSDDAITVYIGGVFQTEGTEYVVVSGTATTYAIQNPAGNWPIGTDIDIVVTKAVHSVTADADGATIMDGTVAKSKLVAALQTEINNATAHLSATTDIHGAISTATANKLIIRDANGRAQVAAPVAAADIARKDTVDAVQTNLTAHVSATTHITAGERTQWNSALVENGTFISNANTISKSGLYITPAVFTGSPFAGTDGGNQGYLLHQEWGGSGQYAMQIHTMVNSSVKRRYRMKGENNDGLWGPWRIMPDERDLVDIARFKTAAGTFTTRGTTHVVTNAFCTAATEVKVHITGSTQPQGVWTVTSADGSFTITSDKAETADVTFDYSMLKGGM